MKISCFFDEFFSNYYAAVMIEAYIYVQGGGCLVRTESRK